MATQSMAVGADAEAEDVVFGLSANVAAALSYLLPLGIIFLLVEEDNEFVRFNAAQSVAYSLGLLLFMYALSFMFALFPDFIALLLSLFMGLFRLVTFVGLVFMAYKAFTGEVFEAPVFADMGRSLEEAI